MEQELEDDLEAEYDTTLFAQEITVQATGAEAGQRLDRFVTGLLPGATRSEVQRLIELPADVPDGVRVNARREKPGYRLRTGDVITVSRPAPCPVRLEPEAIPLDILYEDAHLLVIDKPRGMVVHPAPGAEHGTLVHAVLAHTPDLSGVGGEIRPGIVHRLDKDTGGLIVVAKTDTAHRNLQAQIQARTADRRYLAIVWGVPHFQSATVDAPIGRHPVDRKKMAVITDPRYTARPGKTDFSVRETFADGFALLEARLHTGRTHQIRVHCAYMQHPVVGDPVYGGLRKLSAAIPAQRRTLLAQAIADLQGQALHAFQLAFDHPITGERMAFTSPLPDPIQRVLEVLRAPVE
ncbi:MAG: RluA family pseudouridine synthase [Chloroherpetonaceae bacterium]|nr:RluA family pseudouridine synthase [Chthonomonadaceae bacterium]MDW8206378.1 RluA family pseudouridine synthase [Chloroherpetonaceae bacterium]